LFFHQDLILLSGSNDVQASGLFEQQMNQISLGVNGAVLEDHERDQQTVRNDEKEDEQWQHRLFAFPPYCRTYRVIHLFTNFRQTEAAQWSKQIQNQSVENSKLLSRKVL
jgi:hypothetical protein